MVAYNVSMVNFEAIFKQTLGSIEALRKRGSNKGSYGHSYILGGSLQYSGAPYLSYSASLSYRGGIGYVHLALPKSIVPAYILKDPQALITPMEEKDGFLKFDKDKLDAIMGKAKGIAFGMGVGNNIETAKIAEYLLNSYHGVLILDADALNAIAKFNLTGLLFSHVGPLVISPHLLEFSRLTGIDVKEVEAKQRELAKEYAKKWNCTIVLKSFFTYVSDGEETYEITSGNSGLAKAGSGDLLSGLIVGLTWAYPNMGMLELSSFASYLLGKAADQVARKRNGVGFATNAEDIVKAIGDVLKG